MESIGVVIKKEFLILLGLVVWVVYFIFKLVKNRNNISKNLLFNCILRLGLIEYLALLIGITLFPIRLPSIDMFDVKPFINLDVLSIFDYGFNKYAIINIVGNILLLAPLPALLYLNKFDKFFNVKNTILSSFIISLLIESLQYLEAWLKVVYIPRATDILDLILNTLGGLLGYFIFKLYQKCINSDSKSNYNF